MKNDNLFRFEVFCTSRQLGDALAALSGKVAQISPPQLVANAKPRKGGGIKGGEDTKLVEMFTIWLGENKQREITSKVAKQFLQSSGRSGGSSSYLMRKLRETGQLKKAPGAGKTESRYIFRAPSKAAAAAANGGGA